MGLVKQVFDKIGFMIDDRYWKPVKQENVELRFWVEKFAFQASKYQNSQGRNEDFWDEGIAYMALNFLGKINNPEIHDPDNYDYAPLNREDYPPSEFDFYKKQKIDSDDIKIIEFGLRNSRGQYDLPSSADWFKERRKMFGL